MTSATTVVKSDITALGIPGEDTDTHRSIQVNDNEILGNNNTALNLKAGSNMTITNNNGTVTFAADDGLPAVTASDNGKMLQVVNGTWQMISMIVADGMDF